MQTKETIAAISTGLTNSGIGIIKISGEEAVSIVDKIFFSKTPLKNSKSHTINYGKIKNENKQILDEVLVMLMKAPKTYTGEDVVEINCHGGVLVLKSILDLLLKNGARLAEPGEFTKRAFLNGKMDLSKAEAVIDVIHSKNQLSLLASLSHLNGYLNQKISTLRKIILNEIAYIEAALDDPENYSLLNFSDSLESKISKIKEEILSLIKSFENGKLIKEGLETVILGKPNVGKSSLLNLLLNEDRAIVSDIAGTTRDIIKENINLDGISLNIIDTAGIRKTDDSIENIGVQKAKNLGDKADLILLLLDSNKNLDENDFSLLEFIKNKKAIILLNKIDTNMLLSIDEVSKHTDKEIILFSTKTRDGLIELENKIKNLFFNKDINFNDEIYISNLRHLEALKNALKDLNLVSDSIKNQVPEDFFSIDLLNAYENLGLIIGENINDDLVNEIFSKFCMGK